MLKKIKSFKNHRNETEAVVSEGTPVVTDVMVFHLDVATSTQLFIDACVKGDLSQMNAYLDQANVLLPVLGFGELLPLNVFELKAVQFCVSEEKIDAYEATLSKVAYKTQNALLALSSELMYKLADSTQYSDERHLGPQCLSLAKLCNALILSTQKEVSSSANQVKKKLIESLESNSHLLSGHSSVHFLYGQSMSKLKMAFSPAEKPAYLKERRVL